MLSARQSAKRRSPATSSSASSSAALASSATNPRTSRSSCRRCGVNGVWMGCERVRPVHLLQCLLIACLPGGPRQASAFARTSQRHLLRLEPTR
eukprot:93867-Chlamydomonas_euryale.AAC.1